ncbi:TIGR03086 family metal-binding protein [Streptosporangium carneum]|uniref:TIGR03086 family protein n=1 Tax=Streptosporangium carneum TaxID=47481 RepID=A0A9W6I1P7_9ACTN|nr:TIGR03086 family metal-binding protein [Streptosporangium carneum]GLK09394.1 TIGR03086 family protein [Streptosporangium carneum]
MDIRELNRRAVRASVDVVAKVTAEDLGRPTPCEGWTLADLLAHMIAQHRGFAAAARGTGADPEAWRVRPVGDDAVSVYTEAAEQVLEAFAEEGVPDRVFTLPEFAQPGSGREPTFPGTHAVGFHFIDYLVHAWDVARSLDVDFAPDPELVEAAWPIALAVPDDERRLRPGAAFRPSVAVPQDASSFDRILALLGRAVA